MDSDPSKCSEENCLDEIFTAMWLSLQHLLKEEAQNLVKSPLPWFVAQQQPNWAEAVKWQINW